jgi:hypothetical protein
MPHTFSNLYAMFQMGTLTPRYLRYNVTATEQNTFRRRIENNMTRYVNGRVFSQRQIEVLKWMYLMKCKTPDSHEYHSKFREHLCQKCKVAKNLNRMMTCSVCTNAGQECSVCLMPMENDEVVATMQCTHQFHKKCILSWLECKHNCPYCRRNFISNKN